MSRSAEASFVRIAFVSAALAVSVAGCSDIYFDRREALSFHGGDAAAANIAVQTIDPWPHAAGNRNLEANGERMQRAMERYRTNKTTPLMTTGTSSVPYIPVLAPAAPASTSQ